jgi:predicted nucleotidyltransferase
MRDWLKNHFFEVPGIAEAYMFGSAMRGVENPRDVDIALVTLDPLGSVGWEKVRSFRDRLTPVFSERFGLPLSIIIASPSEWRTISGGIVRERELLYRSDI